MRACTHVRQTWPGEPIGWDVWMSHILDCRLLFHCRTWFETLFSVYRQDGIPHGLYRGLSLNFVRVVPQVAVSFTVYERAKQYLNISKAPWRKACLSYFNMFFFPADSHLSVPLMKKTFQCSLMLLTASHIHVLLPSCWLFIQNFAKSSLSLLILTYIYTQFCFDIPS